MVWNVIGLFFFIKEYMYFKYEFKINKRVEMLFLFEDVYSVVNFVYFLDI